MSKNIQEFVSKARENGVDVFQLDDGPLVVFVSSSAVRWVDGKIQLLNRDEWHKVLYEWCDTVSAQYDRAKALSGYAPGKDYE